jgi:hypothetical protein
MGWQGQLDAHDADNDEDDDEEDEDGCWLMSDENAEDEIVVGNDFEYDEELAEAANRDAEFGKIHDLTISHAQGSGCKNNGVNKHHSTVQQQPARPTHHVSCPFDPASSTAAYRSSSPSSTRNEELAKDSSDIESRLACPLRQVYMMQAQYPIRIIVANSHSTVQQPRPTHHVSCGPFDPASSSTRIV